MDLLRDLFTKPEQIQEQPAPVKVGPLVKKSRRAHKLFSDFNAARLARMNEQLGDKGQQALALLPFLFHTNNIGLPGYSEGNICPAGIASYETTLVEIELAARLFPRAAPKRTPILKMAIDMIAVMGSAGSIGFSEASDLDIWVCFRQGDFAGFELDLLRKKGREVEKWMTRLSGVEVHLFIQPTDEIRVNNFGKVDIEGCGSAMGTLLKEEFYRTAILLAGRAPLWWVIPPGLAEAEYGELAKTLSGSEGFDSNAFVDIGPVTQAATGELFGAAIWQIAKGQKAPFKSALKMGHLEKTVDPNYKSTLLCERLKEEVLEGDNPDPYRILFDAVIPYYSDRGDISAQELLSECFYLKTGYTLDPEKLDEPSADESETALKEYVRRWGWGRRKIRRLNDFSNWRYETLQELSASLDRFLLKAYKRIYDTLDSSGMTRAITDRDMTVIGRTLQVAYRQSPNKLSRIHLMPVGMREPVLSLIESTLPSGEMEWRLYRGVVSTLTEEDFHSKLIGSFGDMVELLSWAAYNGILDPKSRLLIKPLERSVSSAEVEAVAQLLVRFLDEEECAVEDTERLLSDPLPSRMLVVPNLGSEESEIIEISTIYQTTWGETFYRSFTGATCFRQFVEEILLYFWSDAPDPSRMTVYAPRRKVYALSSPAARLKKGMPKMMGLLGVRTNDNLTLRRQVLATAEGYLVVELSGSFTLKNFATHEQLMRYLASVGPYDSVLTRIDEDSDRLKELGLVFNTAEKARVNIFVVEKRRCPEIYVVDEIGNLYHTLCDDLNSVYTLSKLLIFLDLTLPDVRSQPENPLSEVALSDMLRIFKISTEPAYRVYPATHEYMAKVSDLGLNPMGLTIERTPGKGGDMTGYKITWGNEIIRSGEAAHPLEELKKRIRESRNSEHDYGVYVTRLFLDEQFQKKSCGTFAATGHHLFYKGAIEARLNG